MQREKNLNDTTSHYNRADQIKALKPASGIFKFTKQNYSDPMYEI